MSADLVVDVDPRHVLIAACERPAAAQLEDGKELLQEARLRLEDEAGANRRDANAALCGLGRACFPVGHHLREEVAAAGGVLVEDPVAVLQSVVPDGCARRRAPSAVGFAASMPSTRFLVARMRLSLIRFFTSSFQRWLISSPTRLMTASTPSNAAAGGRSAAGSHAMPRHRRVRLPRLARGCG